MRGAWDRWASYLSGTENGRSQAYFRMAVGACLVWLFGSAWIDGALEPIWTGLKHGGYRQLQQPPLIRILGGATPENIHAIATMGIISGAALVAGVFPRFFALAGMLLAKSAGQLNSHAFGGYDDLLANALWLLVFSGSAATLSFQCRWRTGRWTSEQRIRSWPRYLAVLQLLVMYSSAGIHKVSVHWLPFGDLDAIWYILQDPGWARSAMAPPAWLALPLKLATLASWLFEVLAPLLLLAIRAESTPGEAGRLGCWMNRLQYRKLFIVFGLLLHSGIILFLSVEPFSLCVLAYYPCLRLNGRPKGVGEGGAPVPEPSVERESGGCHG
jgi:hypothetical protein